MLEARLLKRIETKKAQLDQLRSLPQAELRRREEQLMVEWIYNSNAIEGNMLTLRETRLILETGLTSGGKSLREHFEVINHREAIQFVEALAKHQEPLTLAQIRQLHQLVFKLIDDERAGQYRQLPVRIAGALHQPPDAREAPRLMSEWLDWLNGPAQQEHPVVRSALAHHRFVAIHPFIDGNGRTARLLMNLLLRRDGYPPAIILNTDRRQYYRILALADNGDAKPFVNFVGQAVEQSLTLYVEAGAPQHKPAAEETWISLHEAAMATSYDQEYLSLLARMGRLEAIKRGRVWYTTPRALANYQASIQKK